MYTIIDHDKFSPSTYEMFSSGPWIKGKVGFSKQNPTTKDKKDGLYKPRLSVTRRPLKGLGYQNTLYIEVSLPKLVFSNNFDELTNDDFELVINKLYEVLKSMGVLAYPSKLPQANISSIHYGKNIILEDYTTPYSYIKELKKVDINKIIDVNQTDYRNGGLSYKFHSNLFEFTFYDKIKDLEKSKLSEKRAINKSDYCQLSLLDYIDTKERITKPFEVLRLEIRLNNRTKIKQYLKKLKLDNIVTFDYLFNTKMAKLFLLSFYDKIFDQYIPTFETSSIIELVESIKASNPEIKDGKVLELASSQNIINQLGVRELRNMVNDRTWYRVKNNLKKLNGTKSSLYLSNLRNKIDNFKQVRLVDYPQLMLNNVN